MIGQTFTMGLFMPRACIFISIAIFAANSCKNSTEPSERGPDFPEPPDSEFYMIAPFVDMSDMAPVREAYSEHKNVPWGFVHGGLDFFPNKNFTPFHAVAPGVITNVELWANDITGFFQVNITLRYNATYSVSYAYEPFSLNQADGQKQAQNILVKKGDPVARGDTLGMLLSFGNGAHVDFSLLITEKSGNVHAVCPESYFTSAVRDSILILIRRIWPAADMCYF